jgi:hypothetical protein
MGLRRRLIGQPPRCSPPVARLSWHRSSFGIPRLWGNSCMSLLPPGPMITMTVALEVTYTLWTADGSERTIDRALSSRRTARTCSGRARSCGASTSRSAPRSTTRTAAITRAEEMSDPRQFSASLSVAKRIISGPVIDSRGTPQTPSLGQVHEDAGAEFQGQHARADGGVLIDARDAASVERLAPVGGRRRC